MSEQIGLRISKKMNKELEKLAKESYLTRSEYIRLIISKEIIRKKEEIK